VAHIFKFKAFYVMT